MAEPRPPELFPDVGIQEQHILLELLRRDRLGATPGTLHATLPFLSAQSFPSSLHQLESLAYVRQDNDGFYKITMRGKQYVQQLRLGIPLPV
jgi:hypothetical protein